MSDNLCPRCNPCGIVGGSTAVLKPTSCIVGNWNRSPRSGFPIVGGDAASLDFEPTSTFYIVGPSSIPRPTCPIVGGNAYILDLGPGIYGLKHRDGKEPIYLFEEGHQFTCEGCETLARYLKKLQREVDAENSCPDS